MKMEIDLNDILGDEYGTESIEESVRRQVTEYLVNDFKKKVGKIIDDEISKKVSNLINEQLESKFPGMIEDLWNMEYIPVTQWGQIAEKTTLKNQLLKVISEQIVYKNTGYSSDKNAFTKNVDLSIEKAMTGFRKDFDSQVTDKMRKEALKYALNQIIK